MLKRWGALVAMMLFLTMSLDACEIPGKGNENDVSKYNAYVDLSNYMTGWLDLDIYGYTETFGLEESLVFRKKGFDPKKFEGNILTPIIQGTFDQVDKALQWASQKPSYGAADESMKDLSPKMKELLATINEVDAYYRSKAFAGDDFAKGKELHAKLYTQYKAYKQSAGKFFTDFDAITGQKQQEELDMLKSKDLLAHYYAESIVIRAQDIERAFFKANVDDSNLLEFDANQFKEKYELLSKDVDKFLEYAKDKPRLDKEGIKSFWGFDQAVPLLRGAAGNINQALQSGSLQVKSASNGKAVSGQGDGMLEFYHKKVAELIGSYNKMIQ